MEQKNFVFYTNPTANGSADTDNCACPSCCHGIKVNVDTATSLNLSTHLSQLGLNVSALTFWGPPSTDNSEPSPLKWGEVIPLLFIQPESRTKLLILSEPSRRYNRVATMVQELLNLGHHLDDYLESLPESVIIVASGDLAHTHMADGPYGYSDDAQPFDHAVGAWARTLHPSSLLTRAADLTDGAMSCGFPGFVILHGVMERGGLHHWSSSLYANSHPSYYGMMTATFYKYKG